MGGKISLLTGKKTLWLNKAQWGAATSWGWEEGDKIKVKQVHCLAQEMTWVSGCSGDAFLKNVNLANKTILWLAVQVSVRCAHRTYVCGLLNKPASVSWKLSSSLFLQHIAVRNQHDHSQNTEIEAHEISRWGHSHYIHLLPTVYDIKTVCLLYCSVGCT